MIDWWLGADPARLLGMTGWVGETPEGDAAFLLLYPLRAGSEADMRALAQALGLRPALDGAPEPAKVSAQLDGDMIELALPTPIAIPANTAYQQTARRGWGVLMVGCDAWDGLADTLDDYTAGLERFHAGLITVARTNT